MTTIEKEYVINANIESVWQCLVDADEMEAWDAGPASFDAKVGGEFNMWGDYLYGEVIVFDEPNVIEETWIVDGMDEPSKIKVELSESDGSTKVTLNHTNVPEELAPELDDGWDKYYFGAIKDYLENK